MTLEQGRMRARMLAVALGVSVLFWLPVEDSSPLTAQFLALLGAAALGVRMFPYLRKRLWLPYAGWGLVCGLAVAPLTAVLMIVKIGLHGHGGIPDFSTDDFLAVILRTPVFAAAGLLVGTGLYTLTD